MQGMTRSCNWQQVVIAALIGCAVTASVMVLQPRFDLALIVSNEKL
jgi:hypothetical protein